MNSNTTSLNSLSRMTDKELAEAKVTAELEALSTLEAYRSALITLHTVSREQDMRSIMESYGLDRQSANEYYTLTVGLEG